MAATSRLAIVHGHITVNGRKLDRPSYRVSPGDVIAVRDRERSRKHVQTLLGESPPPLQPWLERDDKKLEGRIADLPTREVLLGTLLGVINAPASKLVRTLNEPGASLARVIQAKFNPEG